VSKLDGSRLLVFDVETMCSTAALRSYLLKNGINTNLFDWRDDALDMLLGEMANGTSALFRMDPEDFDCEPDDVDEEFDADDASSTKQKAPATTLQPGCLRIVRILQMHLKAKTSTGEVKSLAFRGVKATANEETLEENGGESWNQYLRPLSVVTKLYSGDPAIDIRDRVWEKLGLSPGWQSDYMKCEISHNTLELRASTVFTGLHTCYLTSLVEITIMSDVCPIEDCTKLGLPDGVEFETIEPAEGQSSDGTTHLWAWTDNENASSPSTPQTSPRSALNSYPQRHLFSGSARRSSRQERRMVTT